MALNIKPLFPDRFAVNNVDLPNEKEYSPEAVSTCIELENEALSQTEKKFIQNLSKEYFQKLLNIIS